MDSGLIDSVRRGDPKALARAISAVESGKFRAPTDIEPPPGVIGITGPPGVGKSTLIASMVRFLRRDGVSVGVLAVDPSSPITGGALLGDRIRMQEHIDDEGVFIRSMATRGHLGGLAVAAGEALKLIGLAGYDRVLVETVGVGQSEVEVMGVADHVVLVIGPGWGDHIQADKAGVVEIADVYVVNKSDRPGTEEVRRAMSETARQRGAEILMTTATTGEGVEDLLAVIDRLTGS